MRIWDLDPGYLDRQRLLGEHRELHGMFNILTQGKKGYSRHPETLRWAGRTAALALRHELLVEEMGLRGYNHRSPLPPFSGDDVLQWPETFINTPAEQFTLLHEKQTGEPGRIFLPCNRHTLWAQHKYSTMARDPELYKRLGPEVAAESVTFPDLALLLVKILRTPPPPGRLMNALLHMLGYLERKDADLSRTPPSAAPPAELLDRIRRGIEHENIGYLRASTASGELGAWIRS